MESKKTMGVTFSEIIHYLKEVTGRREASFSSKLVAIINPNKPVRDKYVLNNLGLKAPYATAKNSEQIIVKLYDDICEWYNNFLNGEEGK